MIDVVIPAHKKDIETLDLCIDGVKNSVRGLRNVYVVSKDRLTEEAEWIPESSFPFSLDDVSSIIGRHWRTCWYYQQLLKLYALFTNEEVLDSALFVDSDTIFLNEIDFNKDDVAYFNIGKEEYPPYFEHMSKLLPGLERVTPHSGITHHMVFQRDILKILFSRIEEIHDCPFWEAFLKTTLGNFKSVIGDQSHEGQGRASEYEIYFNYCMINYPDRTKIRKLKSILAYKEELSDTQEHHTIGSRTNDDQHIRIMEEDDVPEFENVNDSFLYVINRCKELGYDSVTFQKHTRQGHEDYKKDSLDYIMEFTNDSN